MQKLIAALILVGAVACAKLGQDQVQPAPKEPQLVCTATGAGVLWTYNPVTNQLAVCGANEKGEMAWLSVKLSAPQQQAQQVGQAPQQAPAPAPAQQKTDGKK